MNNSIKALRLAVLINNSKWLRSFGCKVRCAHELMYIQHPELPDYNACLILNPPNIALERMQMLIDEINQMPIIPNIYVDEDSISEAFHSTLTANGFKAVYTNTTMAGIVTPIPAPKDFVLNPLRFDDFDLWLSLYSEGFNRYEKDAEIDRSRWSQAFRSHEGVKHWFIIREKTPIGICQTCVGSGVVGVYSFTIKPLARSFRNLQGSIGAIRVKLTEQGNATIYLELLENEGSISRRGINRYLRELVVIRKMIGYHRSF